MTVPATMPAMVLERPGQPLRLAERTVPAPAPNQILIAVSACGVCRTDLHILDGELPQPKLPLVPRSRDRRAAWRRLGRGRRGFRRRRPRRRAVARVDRRHLPLLPPAARRISATTRASPATRSTAAMPRYTVADARYAFKLPDGYSDAEAAPLLCAGLIGYRSLKMAGDRSPAAFALGIYGFGAAAHIVAQVATAQGREVYRLHAGRRHRARRISRARSARCGPAAPTRRRRKRSMPPSSSRPSARWCRRRSKRSRKGGVVVCGGIHMSDIPSFPYEILWEERSLRSVANLTRDDAREFLALAPKVEVKTSVSADAAPRRQRGACALAPRRADRRRGADPVEIVIPASSRYREPRSDGARFRALAG